MIAPEHDRANTYYQLIANNPFGVYLVDSDFRLREISKGAQAVFATVENAIGQDFCGILRIIWTEPFASEVIGRFQHTLQTGEPYEGPSTTERRADTDAIEAYDWRIERVLLPDGRFGVVCYFYDLSEREHAADVLAESEAVSARQAAELDLLYAQAPLGLAMLDAEQRFVRINEALAQINGFPVQAHLGRTVWDLIPGIRDSAEPALLGVLKSGVALTDVLVIGTTPSMPDQTREWREQFYPVKTAAGNVIGIGIICEEVTERRRIQRDLTQRTAELEALLSKAPLGIAFFDRQHRFLRINEELADSNGLSVQEHLGRSLKQVWPEIEGEVGAVIEQVFQTGEAVRNLNVTGPSTHVAGETHHWLASYFPVRDDADKVSAVGAWVIDMTDERRKEEELLRLTTDLEALVEERTASLIETNVRLEKEIESREAAQSALLQSQKLDALGRLTSGIAHDFGNVVQAITSGFELIEKWSDDPRVHEVVRHSVGAAERGGGLIKQLLAFARQETLAPVTTDLRAFIGDTWPLLSRSVGPGIDLSAQCPDDIGFCRIDPSLLEAALINLVINARDAMPEGGKITIALHALATDAERPQELGGTATIVIVVSDTGTGMTQDVAARVMEPFFTTKAPGKGTGLGLAMVHGFVRQSGGAMRIDSAPGEGTAITLYLRAAAGPISVINSAAESGALADAAGHTLPDEAPRKRLLIVDDDDAVRSITSALLAELGYDVLEATGGKAALAALNTMTGPRPIDAILSDISMPGMDGIELAAQIGVLRPELPVMFLTGHSDFARRTDRPVLTKPFTQARLKSAIDALFAEPSAQAPLPLP